MTAIRVEDIKKKLFRHAMNGKWHGVEELYSKHPEAQRAKITRSGETALHIAVADGQELIVRKLVKLIAESKNKEALGIKDDRGNTPLHSAALLGNVPMCECISNENPELIGARNLDGETPFFLAALHGRKDAFLRLHSICEIDEKGKGYLYCRRSDGDTILHCAIDGEYFDLAFQIICLYENLVHYRNEQGFSPLRLLATKPSAFRSGSRIRRFGKVIYHCVFVGKLEPQTHYHRPLFQELEVGDNKFPENYRTCVNFGRLAWTIIRIIVRRRTSDPGEGEQPDTEDPNPKGQQIKAEQGIGAQRPYQFPPNYAACFESIKLIAEAILILFVIGLREFRKIRAKKEKHLWSVQILNELLQRESCYEYEDNGQIPQHAPLLNGGETMPYAVRDGGIVDVMSLPSDDDSGRATSQDTTEGKQSKTTNEDDKAGKSDLPPTSETAILIAAKNGVVEMVKKILQIFPVAINDMNSEMKNVFLLAAENGQPQVFKLLLEMKKMKDSVFRQVDKDGNSALHLAARLGEHRHWLISGAALQMQWEIRWYEYVENSVPPYFFVRLNNEDKTAKEVFTETHKGLVTNGGEWLAKISDSCSVVSALMATVAFATSCIVPGGVKETNGTPTLEKEPAFDVYAVSSLVALCFSVISVAVFLALLTSRYEEKDFRTNLPRKLLVGFTSLFVSMTSMLISFCAENFFVLKDKLKYAASPVYAVICLLVTVFSVAQFPLYFDLIWATFKKVPQRSFKVIPP